MESEKSGLQGRDPKEMSGGKGTCTVESSGEGEQPQERHAIECEDSAVMFLEEMENIDIILNQQLGEYYRFLRERDKNKRVSRAFRRCERMIKRISYTQK